MNELRKLFQHKAAPQHNQEETKSNPFHMQTETYDEFCKGPTLLDAVQQELAEAKLQIAQLQDTKVVLYKEITAAVVQSHESEAALLLVQSQLEGLDRKSVV